MDPVDIREILEKPDYYKKRLMALEEIKECRKTLINLFKELGSGEKNNWSNQAEKLKIVKDTLDSFWYHSWVLKELVGIEAFVDAFENCIGEFIEEIDNNL